MASPQPPRDASTAPSQRVARKAVGASSIHSASPRPVSLALRPASTWSAPPIHPQPGQQHQYPNQLPNQYPQTQPGQYGHPQQHPHQGQPVAQPNSAGGIYYPQQQQPHQYRQPQQQHQSPSQQYQQPSQQHHQPNQQQQLPSQQPPQPQPQPQPQQQQPPYQQPQHHSPHQQQAYPNQQQPQPQPQQQQPQQQQAYPQQHEHQQPQQLHNQVPYQQPQQTPPQPQQQSYQQQQQPQQQVPQPQQQHDYHQQLSQQQQQQQPQPHQHQPSISNPSAPQNPPQQPTPGHQVQPPPASPTLQRPQSISDNDSIHSFTAEHGRPPSISSSSAGVATPGTTITTPSTLTSPLWEHAAVPPPAQPAPIGRASTGQDNPNSMICNHCRKAIPPNVSIYTCLICSTAHITTTFCVWCFTANAVNMSHGHDKTYYVTDSDPRVQLSVPDPTSHLWTIRKNVSGRLWYTHNSTGLKTHIKPTAAALSGYSGLPAGWEERRTPDGRTFYFNRKMGSSSWTKPANSLPDGWKELRTPDLVPFYINESLGLSTWDRPGQQPRKRPGQSNKVVTRSRSGQPNNNQNAGDAILSATINAARLTGHGVEVASRQMGKLGKKKNWKKMGRIMTQASGLSMDSDGEGGGGNSSDDRGYEEQGQYQENSGFQQATFSEQQSFTDGNQAQAGYQQPVYEQQATYQYSAQQEQPVFEQPAQYDNSGQFSYPGNEPQQGYEQQQEPQYQYGQNPAYDQQPVQEQQPVPQQPVVPQERPQYYAQEAQQQPGQQQPVMPQEQPQYYTQEAQQQPTQQPLPQQPILPQEQPQYYAQEAQQRPIQQPVQQQVPQQPIHQPVPTQQHTSFDLVMPPDQNNDVPPQVPQEPYMPPQPSQQPAVTNQVPTTQASMYTFQQPFFYDPTPTTQVQAPVAYQTPVYSPTYVPPEQNQLPHNNQPEIITSDAPLVETYNSDSTTIFVDDTSFVTGSGQQNAVNEPISPVPDSQGDIVVEVTIQQQPEPLDVPGQSSLEVISTPEPLITQENDQAPDSSLAAQSTQLEGDMDASTACLALI